jgi:cell division protein FtsQ
MSSSSFTNAFSRLAGRPWAWVVLGVVALGLVLAGLRYAPFFSVEQISVSGNDQVTSSQVVQAAAVPDGTRVLTAPLDDIAGRIESLDAVADATVTRDWPNGLKVVVRERRPVGYVTLDNGVGLVGSDGQVYRVEPAAPRQLPQLPDAAVGRVGDSYRGRLAPLSVAAFDVAVSLPLALQRQVREVAATPDGDVLLTADDGVTIAWGGSDHSAAKAHVVMLLLRRPGWGSQFREVDVSAPQAPALG